MLFIKCAIMSPRTYTRKTAFVRKENYHKTVDIAIKIDTRVRRIVQQYKIYIFMLKKTF